VAAHLIYAIGWRRAASRRLDETLAARKPVLVYQKAPQAAAAE